MKKDSADDFTSLTNVNLNEIIKEVSTKGDSETSSSLQEENISYI